MGMEFSASGDYPDRMGSKRWGTAWYHLFLAAFVFGCSAREASGGATPSSGHSRPPDFELPTLDGQTVRLSDYLGRDVILIDFWATYCKPCLTAMPELEALYREHKDRGLVVLGVSLDAADQLDDVRVQVSKSGVTFPILLDQETRVVALYNPRTSAPYSVLIGRDGRILHKQEGFVSTSGSLEADVIAALK